MASTEFCSLEFFHFQSLSVSIKAFLWAHSFSAYAKFSENNAYVLNEWSLCGCLDSMTYSVANRVIYHCPVTVNSAIE